ncbi:MAG TPA: LamG-like jellyroll fold domain-containing protein [Dongiaceae bacterium]|nr:LamG-like jellyroll fold domain-containing protein [Dongiaceae bacterium]
MATVDVATTGTAPLLDDAVSKNVITVTDTNRIAAVNVGVLINHPRESDLTLTLVSPQGTRVLLAENRGGTDGNGYGKQTAVTNVTIVSTNGFEMTAAGSYQAGTTLDGWTVQSNQVSVINDPSLARSGNHLLALAGGSIAMTLPTVAGHQYVLRYAYRGPDIVGLWRGEGNAVDGIAGNNGAVQNISYAAGKVGQAFVSSYSFNPPHSRISVPDQPAYALTHSLSIDGWINSAGPTGTSGEILWRGDCRAGFDPYAFGLNGDNTLSFQVTDASGTPAAVNTLVPLPPNQWWHVAATLDDSTGNMSIYVNGVLAAQTNTALRPFGSLLPDQEPSLGIGNTGTTCWDYIPFNGDLDEISLYGRALSSSEIKAIFDAGSAGKFDSANPLPQSLAEAQVVLSGLVPKVIQGDNTTWQTDTIAFTASEAATVFQINGMEPGMLLDDISLTETNVVRSGYFVFTENTNLTTTPIKYFVPPFRSSPDNLVFSNGFEGVVSSNYVAGTFVGSSGWAVTSNFVEITSSTADSGTNALALGLGTISRTLPTVAGHTYRLTYAYRNANLNPIAWWPGNGNANDIIGTNNGTLLNGTSFAAGEHGQAFSFDGVNSNAVTFGNTVGNFGTNNFTVEFWISTTAGGEEAIFEKRPICSFCSMFSIRMGGPGVGSGRLGFEMYSDTAGNNAGSLVEPTLINDGMYHHAAFVRQGTNLNFYIDGSQDASGTTFGITSISNNADFKIGNSVCYPGDGTVPFAGKLDELTFFDQALSPVQIQAIYLAGAAGKCGTPIPPDICGVDNAQVILSGISTNTISGGNGWSVASQTFTATGGTVLQFQGVNAGLLLDSVSLAEVNSDGVALPEESLSKLKGEVAYGDWTLEIWDNRAGAPAPADALEGWELQFVYDNTVPLTPGLENGQVRFFQVNVPNWAQVATNMLISASGPVDVWFTTNNPPSLTNAGDLLLQAGAAAGYITNITVTGTPQLPAPGIYWLGATNPNPTAVTGVRFQVDFNVTVLTNNAALAKDAILTNQTQDVTDPTRYFAFDVSSNATAVLFRLFDMTGNVDLVARRGAPLPTATSYDYASVNFGTNEDSIMVLSNSVPVPLAPGTWYLGVINADSVPVNYSIEAVEYTNIIINLTNTVPYQNTNSGVGALVDYYHYAVTNDPAGRVQFEINNPDGDVALVARKGLPLPDLSFYDYLSDNPGTNDELIVILTNSTPVALSPGDWFLGVVNNTGLPVSYTVKATEWPLSDVVTNGPTLVDGSFDGTNGFCLTWKSLVGAHYYVQGNAKLSLTNWATMSPTITATSNYTTWCISPLPAPDYFFFRVVDGLAINSTNAGLIISSIVVNTNGVLLGWNGPANAQYHVQWTPSIKPPPVWNTFSNIVTSPTNAFQFLDDGSQSGGVGGQTRFYRLKVP